MADGFADSTLVGQNFSEAALTVPQQHHGAQPNKTTDSGPDTGPLTGSLSMKVQLLRQYDVDTGHLPPWADEQLEFPVTEVPQTLPIHRHPTPRWRLYYTTALVLADAGLAAALALITTRDHAWSVGIAVAYALVIVGVFAGVRVYEHTLIGHGLEEYRRVGTAGLSVIAATALAAYAGQWSLRGFVLVAIPATVVSSLLAHLIARQLLFEFRRNRGRCTTSAVVIGSERSVAEMVRTVTRNRQSGIRVVAACVTRSNNATIEGVPVAGTPNQAFRVAQETHADAVLLTAWSDVSEADLRRLSWNLEGSGVKLFVAPRIAEVAAPRMQVHSIGGVPLVYVDEPEFTGSRRIVKGLLDVGLASLALVVLSPVLLVLAIAVKISSPGPVFFRQERLGRGSQPFKMTKFRSMYTDAEERLAELVHLNEHDGPLFKLRDDPRITPIGRFLRRYSLDELPQLFDVLTRSMSLVGPRPPLPHEVEAYEVDVHRRLLVKPGITGLWQVSGRSDLSWDESVRLDLNYVENWSLGLDLTIIARTINAVLAQRGAY